MKLKIKEDIIELLECPKCHSKMDLNEKFICLNKDCQADYPIIDGIPILINDSNSLFKIDQYSEDDIQTADTSNVKKIENFINLITPSCSKNWKSRDNLKQISELLRKKEKPKVLVIGGRILGVGMKEFIKNNTFDVVETDVAFGPRTRLICDSHDIPFGENSFDCIITQAVLEHVIDPFRCVDEMFRILKPDGLVYAVAPFMKQVHNGQYDFYRFSDMGYRRLFRRFKEIERGLNGGPGQALAWSLLYFFRSFGRKRWSRAILRTVASYMFFWLKYTDLLLAKKPGSYDAASGFYFLGYKTDSGIGDEEILKDFRGAG